MLPCRARDRTEGAIFVRFGGHQNLRLTGIRGESVSARRKGGVVQFLSTGLYT